MKINQLLTETATRENRASKAIKTFNRAATELAQALNNTSIEDAGMSQMEDEEAINPLMVNDIAHHIEIVQSRLEQLDHAHGWKDHMAKRKERFNTQTARNKQTQDTA